MLPTLLEDYAVFHAHVTLWCRQNGMVANTTKTKAMLITTRQMRATLNDDQLQVEMDGQLLANIENDKLLGAMINKNLSWNEHIV